MVPRTSFRAFRVIEVLDRLNAERGRPGGLRVDSGAEVASKMLDRWAYLNGAEIASSGPGKPTDDAPIEAFNARPRAERLSASWFLSMADAGERIEGWRCSYSGDRPHSAPGGLGRVPGYGVGGGCGDGQRTGKRG